MMLIMPRRVAFVIAGVACGITFVGGLVAGYVSGAQLSFYLSAGAGILGGAALRWLYEIERQMEQHIRHMAEYNDSIAKRIIEIQRMAHVINDDDQQAVDAWTRLQ